MRRRRATRRRRARRSRRPTEGAAAAVALATRARGRPMARTALTARMARRRRHERPRAARTARPLKVRENYDAQAHYNYWRAIIGERASRGRLPFPALGCDGNDHPRGGVRRGGGSHARRKHMRLTNGHVGTISGLARERPAWPPVMWSSPWSCRSRRGVGRVHRLTTPELTHPPSLFLCWRPSVGGRHVL